jgi:transcription initiation factor TFIIIB Brf1 subunit/transcription initiation factor TFIIB
MGSGYFDMKPISPSEFIERYMTKSNTPWKYYDEIAEVTRNAEKTHLLHEVAPNGVCAGIIYAVLQKHNEPPEIDSFSKTLGVSATMIKKVVGRISKIMYDDC